MFIVIRVSEKRASAFSILARFHDILQPCDWIKDFMEVCMIDLHASQSLLNDFRLEGHIDIFPGLSKYITECKPVRRFLMLGTKSQKTVQHKPAAAERTQCFANFPCCKIILSVLIINRSTTKDLKPGDRGVTNL